LPAQATKKPRCRGARKLQYRIPLMLHKLRPQFPSPIIPPCAGVTDPTVRREVEDSFGPSLVVVTLISRSCASERSPLEYLRPATWVRSKGIY
jgi:hypothetical protein